ncbi:TonB-dependent receptor [Novosphingobium sediminicola]|uniref:Iron complex outermembrane receptor protein n=1 Tax=Novosphingobium sediminicola TaxID=563162 RepID=A0A7W6G4I9_9SPHN|nr:TonB-dependent receptor [Novosphingobium sediminicola]MBB3953709.1 iron complex outermembrane receptor protein [Novosphingobium sediminicola]
MKKNWLAAISSNLTIALCLQAAPAMAQNSATQTVGAQPAGLGEIVVTAEKRKSTEQKTAIAMSVLTPETLARNGVGSVADLTAVAPSVSFAQAGPATIISVRGVSSRDTSEIGDPAVSISIDGFNLQRALGLNASMFDLERVEVLRGPQGTLLGRNATGGAINIVTAKPKPGDLSAYLGVEAGNYRMHNVKGMINVPVNDWITLRAAFQLRDHDGYRNNAPSANADDEHSRSARLHVLMKPTDRFSLLLTGEYSDFDGVGTATQAIPWVLYTAANVPAGYAVGDVDLGVPPRGNAKDFPMPAGSFLRTKAWNFRAQADYDFTFATLTYQGGYRRFKIDRRTTLGGAYGTNRQNFTFGQRENLPSWNHELRLSSNSKGPLKWQFGGFYFKESNNLTTQFQDFPGQDSISGTPFLIQNYVYPDIVAEAKAAFGQVSYELIPGLTAEAGARYSKDDKHRIGYNTVTNVTTYLNTKCYLTNSCVMVTTPQNSTASSSKTTWHAALNYQATPRNLIYAKFDTGYKAGGFTDLAAYNPESITAYEIGAKNRFLGNRLQLNLSAYLYNYTDQQVSQTVTNSNGAVATLVLNAGSSRYKGVELDALFDPTPDDHFNAYVAYQDARFTNFAAAVSGQLARAAAAEGKLVGANWQLDGKRPPQAPVWTVNLGYEHDFHVFGGRLTPRFQTHIESESYFTFYNFASDRQDSYHRSDIIVTYKHEPANWTLSAFVRNLEDTVVLSSASAPTSATYQTYREQYQAPRTYGASFTYNW